MMSPYRPPPDNELSLHYLDDVLLVTGKPSGLLSVPGRGAEKADCLLSRLHRTIPDALIVHRLDMETSGLILLARTASAHAALSQQFERRQVHKRYTARVFGQMREDQGEIDLPLMKDWPNRPLQKVDHADGKPSLTGWRVLEREEAATRLLLSPETGRTHQLRVHLNAIGHPILGDTLYGSPESLGAAPRLQLHASELGFDHPLTGEPIMVRSVAPF